MIGSILIGLGVRYPQRLLRPVLQDSVLMGPRPGKKLGYPPSCGLFQTAMGIDDKFTGDALVEVGIALGRGIQ